MRGLTLLLAVTLAAGCGGGSPSPSTGDLTAVLGALALRGATIHQQVSGDAGCTDSELHGNAVRLELTLAGDQSRYQVFLFRWRRPADFTAAAASFSACVEANRVRTGAAAIGTLEVRPWRAYGPTWSDRLHETLDAALRATGGG